MLYIVLPFPRPVSTINHDAVFLDTFSFDCLNESTCSFAGVKFAAVTNVTFPPIYEMFLSTIGVFSLDIGWILSATCLASDIDFYDKLL